MASEKLKVSMGRSQLAWLKARQEAGGFANIGDLIRELVRREQETEARALTEEFRRLDADGSREAEPEASVLEQVHRTKRARRETARRS